MKNIALCALFTLVFAVLALQARPLLLSTNTTVVTALADYPVIESKILAKMSPILSERQQIDKTARVVSWLYKTMGLPQAKQVIALAFAHAKKNNIDPYLVVGLIAAESSFRQNIVSHMGAEGYMQVMALYHADKLDGRDVLDAAVNIQTGVQVLADCLKKHTLNKPALGCYNGARRAKDVQTYYDKVTKKQARIKRLVG
jgi:soluble lytic murein transglycosylase